MTRKILKITAITLVTVIGLMLLIVVCYVIYVVASYHRIDDNTELSITDNATAVVSTGEKYSITTYNIGFGAYDDEFSFFMDYSELQNGEIITGSQGKALSKDRVMSNMGGVIDNVKDLNSDFYLFQEVDIKADRSYKVNQYDLLTAALGNEYGRSFAVNFDSAYLFYPFNDPHGKSLAGLATYSKYKLDSGIRRQYPIDNGFAKYFDLDRCFAVYRSEMENGKELVIIHSHMSAYDEGGTIRAKQLELLNSVLEEEYNKGNYVIVGGDFNHDIAESKNSFPTNRKLPEWVYELTNDDLADGYSFAVSNEVPTCRSADAPYVQGETYTAVLDGFIVSDNIRVESVRNIDTGFKYSDHNPVNMEFVLM